MNVRAIFVAFLVGWLTGNLNSLAMRENCTCTDSGRSNQVDQPIPNHSPKTAPHAISSLHALEHSKKHYTFSFNTKIRRTTTVESTTDTFTPFHRYMMEVGTPSAHENFTDLPQLNSWLHYFEAYHNHMARFRGKKRVVFMEIGVQSGGKIPLLRKYFGSGLVYVGIDINPSTKMFESEETDDFSAHIEIGDISNETFVDYVKEKYPYVDIFLDDGGHSMEQQIFAMKHMLPHVQPEGVYMCEDLGTSWLKGFGGVPRGHVLQDGDFVKNTTVGFIYQTMDWFMAPANSGKGERDTKMDLLSEIPDDRFDVDRRSQNKWWKVVPAQVKHIHYYNQLVVYEKGVTYHGLSWKTIGKRIKYAYSGRHEKVKWGSIMQRLDSIFGDGLL